MLNKDKRKGVRAGFKKLGPTGKFLFILTVITFVLAILFFIYQQVTGASKLMQDEIHEQNRKQHQEVMDKLNGKDTPQPIVPKDIMKNSNVGSQFFYSGGYFHFRPPEGFEGAVFQPLGRWLPIWFKVGDDQLFLYAVVESTDSKITAEIHQNKLTVNPQQMFKMGQDEHGFEVIDNYGVPVLQVDFINSYTYMIRGVFKTDATPVDENYHQFPKSTIDRYFVPLAPSLCWVIDVESTRPHRIPDSKEELNAFVEEVKRDIPPMFDYSDGALFSNKRFVPTQ